MSDRIRDVYVFLDRTGRRRDAEHALVEQLVTLKGWTWEASLRRLEPFGYLHA